MNASLSPSSSLLKQLRSELMAHAPFAQMDAALVEQFVAGAQQAYFAPGEVVMAPGSGVATHLFCVRRGSVSGRGGLADPTETPFLHEAGDLFPVGAVLGARAVTTTYQAEDDTFCLCVPLALVQELAARSPVLADFLNGRVMQLLDLSRRALQASFAAQAQAEQTLETPLGSLPRRAPVCVAPLTPLHEALATMHQRRIGSVLVANAEGQPLGILTRHDILGRVTLPQRPLNTAIEEVMSSPLHTLTLQHTAQDAALLMSRHGIRHVPITDGGRVVGLVSERDLFALQRLSLRQLGAAIRSAQDVGVLRRCATDIRAYAAHLLAQGLQARQLTELVSHLNDLLTARLYGIVAQQRRLDARAACWLAFGSEGRGEQTVATDQDNGLVFCSDDAAAGRAQWLALAREVNDALDACGYPLCKGNVMASNPDCCLTAAEWAQRFAHWMEHGEPADLLQASIYFDLRPIAGQAALGTALLDQLAQQGPQLPRFMKQLALNALQRQPPLNWRGAVQTHTVGGREVIDLKLQGTALFVDVARLYALAHGVRDRSTRARLQVAGAALGVGVQESEAWVGAFEFLQMLRLQVQLDSGNRMAVPGSANLVDVAALNHIDRRMLKESLHIAHALRQRLQLDYQR